MHGNGECEACSSLFLKHLICWIWTEFCYVFQRLSAISACLSGFLSSIHFSFFSAVPLPRKSIWQLVVFEDMKCNRDSSLTLKVGQKIYVTNQICCGERVKKFCDDISPVIREFFNVSFAVLLPNVTRWLQIFQ